MGDYYQTGEFIWQRRNATLGKDRCIGACVPHRPTHQTVRHAESLHLADGDVARLTGQVFVIKSLGAYNFVQVARE